MGARYEMPTGVNRSKKPRTNRSAYSQSDQIALVAEVDALCPLCGKALFYEKNGRNYKGYDLAHVYPLNPTDEEVALLYGEPRLHPDVNHPDNLIPLCEGCHGKFDKPRTVEEYRELYGIKASLIEARRQSEIRLTYQLEAELSQVIQSLGSHAPDTIEAPLTLEPKSIAAKLDDTVPPALKRKIRHYVNDYYPVVRSQFLELERNSPGVSDLILSQVRTFYLKQRSLNLAQQEIFGNVVDWLEKKTGSDSLEPAEILASFFIQNCEVFE